MAQQMAKNCQKCPKTEGIPEYGGNTEGFSISSVYGGILRKTEAVGPLPAAAAAAADEHCGPDPPVGQLQ